MRETTESNLCTAPLSLLSRTSYYLKPDETEAPEELASKGIQAVRGVVAETGEAIETLPEKELDLEGAKE